MNSDTVRAKVSSEENVLSRLVEEGFDDGRIVDQLYRSAYSRPATPFQKERVAAYIQSETAAGRSRRRALENVLWAVLNSMEFQLNR